MARGFRGTRAGLACAALLAAACAGPPERDALDPEAARAFVERFERAIAEHDWDAVREAFHPNALVVYQEAVQDFPTRLSPEAWIASLEGVATATEFERRRRIESVEMEEQGRATVRSRLVETVLREDDLLEVETDEMMTLAVRGGATRILGLALWVGGAGAADVERL